MMIEKLKEYIQLWNKIEGLKPCNDPQFMSDFIEYCKNSNKDCWEFYGENGYCGNTATLCDFDGFIFNYGRSICDFEFAFGDNYVKVFTMHHNGFWTPEYISLHDGDAVELLGIIKQKGLEWMGFKP